MTAQIFEFPVSVYVPLAITFDPFVITIDKAAASFQSRIHVLARGPFRLSLMRLYTVISYSLLRGRVESTSGHY